jgi:carbonic anhydrase
MTKLTPLIEKNRAWSERVRAQDEHFFEQLSQQQAPKYLWIGCSDSRVPANQIIGVEHIMVVGHYGCGGVRAALTGARLGLVDNWLRHVSDVAQKHRDEISRQSSDEARLTRLCELNAIEQAVNVCQTTVVQDAWQRGQALSVHAWVYGLHDGRVRDLGLEMHANAALDERYAHALAQLGGSVP